MTISRATEPLFAIRNGVRSVSPYYFEYRTTFKERWRGKSAPFVLQNELGQTEAAVKWGVDSGHIYVTTGNGKSGSPVEILGDLVYSHKLNNHDAVHNLQHCHEPNVRVFSEGSVSPGDDQTRETNRNLYTKDNAGTEANLRKSISGIMERFPMAGSGSAETPSVYPSSVDSSWKTPQKTQSHIEILHENDDILVVNKPGGVPTHPGGIYRYNTLSEILARDLTYPVWPCHRLDKSTSGVIAFAKPKKASSTYMKLLSAKDQVEKWYLARVRGRFTHAACSYTCPLFSVNSSGAYINVSNQTQLPTNSTTNFHFLSYSAEEDFSIVLCRPITGRMHQIRIHLRNLGFPIANDDLYAGNSEMSRFKNSIELEIYEEIWNRFPGFRHPGLLEGHWGKGPSIVPEHVAETEKELPLTISVPDFVSESIQSDMRALSEMRSKVDSRAVTGTCAECNRPLYLEKDGPENGPDTGIWLHALALKCHDSGPNSFSVASPLPEWCR